jgi:hypothetical protein
MSRQQIYVPLAMAVLGFAVTFFILRPARGPLMPVPSGSMVVPSAWRRILLPAQTRPPDPVVTAAPASRAPTTPPAPSAPEAPSSDDNGPPLPVMLSVSSRPGQIQDDDDDRDADPNPVVRDVDIVNTSSDLLSISVLAVDASTQKATHALVIVRPNGQAHVGTESGLKLEPGDTVTLRSKGYRESTTSVQ